ncbi:MAG TPA: hypothetical protein VFN49_04560 [Candidatus Aquilonibacter sp.]|nr:hypothetical protein [Candidatus Aquilonibacter sp.]
MKMREKLINMTIEGEHDVSNSAESGRLLQSARGVRPHIRRSFDLTRLDAVFTFED